MTEKFYLQVPRENGGYDRTWMKDSDFQKMVEAIGMSNKTRSATGVDEFNTDMKVFNRFLKVTEHPENQEVLRANPGARRSILSSMKNTLDTIKRDLQEGIARDTVQAYTAALHYVEDLEQKLTPTVRLELKTDHRGRVSATYTDAAGKEHNAGQIWIRGGVMDLESAEVVIDGRAVKRAGTEVRPGKLRIAPGTGVEDNPEFADRKTGAKKWSSAGHQLRVTRDDDDDRTPPSGGGGNNFRA